MAVYTRDFQMLYHDAAEHDIVKETPEMIKEICEKGEMEIPVAEGYQAVGIFYKALPITGSAFGNKSEAPNGEGGGRGRGAVITAAAHDGNGEANMASLCWTIVIVIIIVIIFMLAYGFSIRPVRNK